MSPAPTDPSTAERADDITTASAPSRGWVLVVGVPVALAAVALAVTLVPASGFNGWRPVVVAMTAVLLILAWRIPVAAVAAFVSRGLTLDLLAAMAILGSCAWSLSAYITNGRGYEVVVGLVVVAGVFASRNFVSATGVDDDGLPRWYVPASIGLAFVTLIAWIAVDGRLSRAFAAAVAVTIVAAPGAVGVAMPAAHRAGVRTAAELGVQFDGVRALRATAGVDAVVFRGLGTLTTGMKVSSVAPLVEDDDRNLRWFAGALEHHSGHPIGRAIARLAPRGRVTGVEHVDGSGIAGFVDRHPVRVGRPSWLGMEGDAPYSTVVGVEVDARPLGTIMLDHVVRPTAAAGVARLRDLGVEVGLVCDAHGGPTSRVADEVGISDPVTGDEAVLSAKVAEEHQARGQIVAVVTKGPDSTGGTMLILGNDTGGTKVAMATPDPEHAGKWVRLARAVDRRGRMVRWFGIGVAGVGGTAAALGVLPPVGAAVVMVSAAGMAALSARQRVPS